MEELQDIMFLVIIKGQDYEELLRRIVSSFNSPLRFSQFLIITMLGCKYISPISLQGFTQLHFTPLEVLAIIEGVQKMCRQDIFKGRN